MSGGCQPAATHCRRTITAMGLFSCSQTTVARPQGVTPRIRVPFSLQRKCSDHFCCRGLKKLVRIPVSGSTPSVCEPLKLLHNRHASQRFSSSSVLPRALGTICSISSGPKTSHCGLRQYPQRFPACRRTLLRTNCGIDEPVTGQGAPEGLGGRPRARLRLCRADPAGTGTSEPSVPTFQKP